MDNRLQKLHSLEDIWSFHCQIPQGMRPPQGEIQGSQIHRISKRALKVQMGRRPVMREGLLVTREVESSPWYVGDCVRSTQDSSLPARHGPRETWGKCIPRKCSCFRRTRSGPWKSARALCTQRRRRVRPAAAQSLPRFSAHWLDTRLDRRATQGHACRAAGPAEQLRDQRQGPGCATSLRSHVSRRTRLKMTVASWHRGESWNPGRRREVLRQEFLPEKLPWVPHRPSLPSNPHGPSLDSRPAPPDTVPAGVYPLSGPAPLTALRVLGRLLGDRRDFLQEPGRTSWSWRGDRR